MSRFASLLAAFALVLCVAPQVLAQAGWPARPIRFLVANSPGSGPDFTARLFADHMSRRTGQPWVVENRPGADGAIAAQATIQSAPDGHSLQMVDQNAVAIDPHMKKSMAFDPLKDFSYIAVVVDETTGLAVAVHPSLPVKSLRDLIDYAKAHPGKLSFSTTISYGTLFGEWLRRRAGMDMVEVRYKTAAQAIQDVVSGRVPVSLQSPGSLAAQVKAGKMRFLAFATSKRLDDWADVPIVAETFPGFGMRGFMLLVGPAGLPREIVSRINRETAAAVKDPAFLQGLQKIYWFNYEGARTPEGTVEFMRAQRERWGLFVKETGIEPG